MRFRFKPTAEILFVGFALLSLTSELLAQRRREEQRQQVGQLPPLVRAFRGRGKSNESLPQAQQLEIGGDKLGQILKGNTTLVRLSVHTPFVNDLGYLIFRTGSTAAQPHPNTTSTADINGLIGKARFTGFVNEIEIGVKPKPNKLYLLDVSVRHFSNCDRCGFSVTGPDGHTESWAASNTSDPEHFYFTFITNDADWYPLMFRGGTFEFEYCAVHEVIPL